MRAGADNRDDGDGPDTETDTPQRLGAEVQDLDPEVQALDRSGPGVRPRTETTTENEPFEEGGSTIASAAPAGTNPAAHSGPRRPAPAADQDETAAARVQAVIAELSRTFGDEVHRGSNSAQAMNLYIASKLPVAAFEQRLFDAAAITKDAVQRRRRSATTEPIDRPMAFFFTVLREALDRVGADGAAGGGGAP